MGHKEELSSIPSPSDVHYEVSEILCETIAKSVSSPSAPALPSSLNKFIVSTKVDRFSSFPFICFLTATLARCQGDIVCVCGGGGNLHCIILYEQM